MKKAGKVKHNITKILKRHRYVVNILIFLLGVIMILIAILPPDINQGIASVSLNIGVSIIASSIIALITLLTVDKNEDIDTFYEEWGLENIYHTRSEMNSHTAQVFPAMNEVYEQIAFGVKSLRDAYTPLFEEKVKKGLKIRFITIHPNSCFLQEREEIENKLNGEIRKTILGLIIWIKKLQKISNNPANIQIKFYDSLPLDFYCRIDDDLYIGPYLYGKESQQTISYRYNCYGKGFKYYTRYFNDLWENDSFLKTLDSIDGDLNDNK
jgi:hypothetical protein